MRHALLLRDPSTDQGTFGRGRILMPPFEAFTGELPWRDNARGLSCIPPGQYRCVWALSPRLKRYTYRLVDVPGRDGVLIHSANLFGDKTLGFVAQLEGCISLGYGRGVINGQRALLVSKPAVRAFEVAGNKEDIILEVRNA